MQDQDTFRREPLPPRFCNLERLLASMAARGIDGFDGDEGQAIFVNIAGVIDLAQIRKIGEALDLPGLEALEEIEN